MNSCKNSVSPPKVTREENGKQEEIQSELEDDPCLFVSWKDLQKSCSQERNRMKVDCRSLMNQQQQLIENERKIAAAKKQEEKNLIHERLGFKNYKL